MKSLSKNIKYLTLISLFALIGCYGPYRKNKYKIKNVTIIQKDSCIAIMQFKVNYYVDSLSKIRDGICMGSGEKGLDGMDATISFIEEGKYICNKNNCEYDNLKDLSFKINNKEKMYNGEFILKDKYICLSKNIRIIMLLKNIKTGIIDTIPIKRVLVPPQKKTNKIKVKQMQ